MPRLLHVACATVCHGTVVAGAFRASMAGQALMQVSGTAAPAAGEQPAAVGAALLEASSSEASAWHGFKNIALFGLRGGVAPRELSASSLTVPGRRGPGRSGATRLSAMWDPEESRPAKPLPMAQPGLEDVEEELITVSVKGGDSAWTVDLPLSWANEVVPGSVILMDVYWSHHAEVNWASALYKASLSVEPHTVYFKLTHPEDPRTERERHIGGRLTSLQRMGLVSRNHIVPIYDFRTVDDHAYSMFPAGDSNLRRILDSRLESGAPDPGTPLLAQEVSLSLLIDILRGVVHLKKAGIILADLTEHTIQVRSDRAFVGGLDNSYIAHDGDEGFGISSWSDTRDGWLGSAYRHAPEMVTGLPTGAPNAIWSLGLIYAEMVLGYRPTELPGPKAEEYDMDEEGRKSIRDLIVKSFFIDRVQGFDKSPSWTQELLKGMLAKSEHDRWTAEEALERALSIAGELRMEVRPETSLPTYNMISPRPEEQ